MSGSRRRTFGTVRRLPSGRWQARFYTPNGRRHLAPTTFATRAQAGRYLASVDLDRARGAGVDPRAGRERFADYAQRWLSQRPRPLRPRTLELYEMLLRRHIAPTFGTVGLDAITPVAIRSWHAELRSRGIGEVSLAKAYRLLRAILATAVEDEALPRNPCRLREAGVERAVERRPPSLDEVNAVAAAIEPRYRLLVLLAAWSGLRWGELIALSRATVDPLGGSLAVQAQFVEARDKRLLLGPPKSDAGRRTVAVPPHLLPELRTHLRDYVEPSRTALLFVGARGAPLHRSNFHVVWSRAQQQSGLAGIRFHDLRHLAATLAAISGATTRELMARMGHSSPRAALIYQHATADRDRAIAAAMSELACVLPLAHGESRPPLRPARPARPAPESTW